MKLRKISVFDSYLMVKWRNENAEYFPSRLYPLTEEEHRAWFFSDYEVNPSDHMYMVTVGGASVGTIGINVRTREIQRVMRGEKYAAPGAMGEALEEIKEAYSRLGSYWLRVLETNPHAIAFYKKHGFFTTKRDGTFMTMEST